MDTQEYIKNYLYETEQIAKQVSQGEIAKAVEILKTVKGQGGRLLLYLSFRGTGDMPAKLPMPVC